MVIRTCAQLGYDTKLDFLGSCLNLRACVTSAIAMKSMRQYVPITARGTMSRSVLDRLSETGTSVGRNKLFHSPAIEQIG
jgi:hypothetical protein